MKYKGIKIVYEIGDWVMPTDNVSYWNRDNSFPCRIREINDDCADCNDRSSSCYMGNLRPATQEEINKATQEEKIMVGEYEVEFLETWRGKNKANRINIDSVTIYEDQYLEIGKKAGWFDK